MVKKNAGRVMAIMIAASMMISGCSMADKAKSAASGTATDTTVSSTTANDLPDDTSDSVDTEDAETDTAEDTTDESADTGDTESTEATRSLPYYGGGIDYEDESKNSIRGGEMEVKEDTDGVKHAGGFKLLETGGEKDNKDYIAKTDNDKKSSKDYNINVSTGMPLDDGSGNEYANSFTTYLGSNEEDSESESTSDESSADSSSISIDDSVDDNEGTDIITPWEADQQ